MIKIGGTFPENRGWWGKTVVLFGFRRSFYIGIGRDGVSYRHFFFAEQCNFSNLTSTKMAQILCKNNQISVTTFGTDEYYIQKQKFLIFSPHPNEHVIGVGALLLILENDLRISRSKRRSFIVLFVRVQ